MELTRPDEPISTLVTVAAVVAFGAEHLGRLAAVQTPRGEEVGGVLFVGIHVGAGEVLHSLCVEDEGGARICGEKEAEVVEGDAIYGGGPLHKELVEVLGVCETSVAGSFTELCPIDGEAALKDADDVAEVGEVDVGARDFARVERLGTRVRRDAWESARKIDDLVGKEHRLDVLRTTREVGVGDDPSPAQRVMQPREHFDGGVVVVGIGDGATMGGKLGVGASVAEVLAVVGVDVSDERRLHQERHKGHGAQIPHVAGCVLRSDALRHRQIEIHENAWPLVLLGGRALWSEADGTPGTVHLRIQLVLFQHLFDKLCAEANR
mmetsp:Transcript_5413/g.12834  ORF Transcript_5413/g.12834 Transcript_5413/m.12834 type:complete len:322 (-) Transcript_5413:858-1823(-)